ncbi:Vps51/Vps67 [Rhizoctonia solani]|uniref:Vps51/Vps67 n=1 Tax=Rhizoctonia solani TaxID=456999 RepID=A0A8H7IIM2_9AGAM|nr:Vps51/Vps67 [Rhizoctonia solani]
MVKLWFKSPGSYTSPDTTKPSLFGNGIVSGREKSVDMDYSHMDPDDMFAALLRVGDTRYNAHDYCQSYESGVFQRLTKGYGRLDADGKREEIEANGWRRERYRDLLHASTAITNMAGTSERVVATLIDMRESCAGILLLDESPRTRHRSIPNGKTRRPRKVCEQACSHFNSANVLMTRQNIYGDGLRKNSFFTPLGYSSWPEQCTGKLSKSPDEDESKKKKSVVEILTGLGTALMTQQKPLLQYCFWMPFQLHVLETIPISEVQDVDFVAESPVSASRRAISPNRAQNRKATAALLSPAASPRSVPSPSVQLLKTPITPSAANAKAEKKTVREVVKAFRAVIALWQGQWQATRAIYGVDGLFTQIIMDIQAEVPSQNIPTTVSQAQFPMSNIIQPSTLTSRNLTTPQILYSLLPLSTSFSATLYHRVHPYVSTDAEGPTKLKRGILKEN